MSEREVCFCCLEEVGDAERKVLPCCGKYYCATCAEKESMENFFETRGCPLCRKTDFVDVKLDLLLDEPRIVLKKDGNVETYFLSERCQRYVQKRLFLDSCHEGIVLLVERGVVDGIDSMELPRIEAAEGAIHELMMKYWEKCMRYACEHLGHAAGRYRRDQIPPILRHFVAHTNETLEWGGVRVKFYETTHHAINVQNLVSMARNAREETRRSDVTVVDLLRYVNRGAERAVPHQTRGTGP